MDKDKSGRDPAILSSKKEPQGKGAKKSLLKNNTGIKNEIKKGCLLVDYIPRLKLKKNSTSTLPLSGGATTISS